MILLPPLPGRNGSTRCDNTVVKISKTLYQASTLNHTTPTNASQGESTFSIRVYMYIYACCIILPGYISLPRVCLPALSAVSRLGTCFADHTEMIWHMHRQEARVTAGINSASKVGTPPFHAKNKNILRMLAALINRLLTRGYIYYPGERAVSTARRIVRVEACRGKSGTYRCVVVVRYTTPVTVGRILYSRYAYCTRCVPTTNLGRALK